MSSEDIFDELDSLLGDSSNNNTSSDSKKNPKDVMKDVKKAIEENRAKNNDKLGDMFDFLKQHSPGVKYDDKNNIIEPCRSREEIQKLMMDDPTSYFRMNHTERQVFKDMARSARNINELMPAFLKVEFLKMNIEAYTSGAIPEDQKPKDINLVINAFKQELVEAEKRKAIDIQNENYDYEGQKNKFIEYIETLDVNSHGLTGEMINLLYETAMTKQMYEDATGESSDELMNRVKDESSDNLINELDGLFSKKNEQDNKSKLDKALEMNEKAYEVDVESFLSDALGGEVEVLQERDKSEYKAEVEDNRIRFHIDGYVPPLTKDVFKKEIEKFELTYDKDGWYLFPRSGAELIYLLKEDRIVIG